MGRMSLVAQVHNLSKPAESNMRPSPVWNLITIQILMIEGLVSRSRLPMVVHSPEPMSPDHTDRTALLGGTGWDLDRAYRPQTSFRLKQSPRTLCGKRESITLRMFSESNRNGSRTGGRCLDKHRDSG